MTNFIINTSTSNLFAKNLCNYSIYNDELVQKTDEYEWLLIVLRLEKE